MFCRRCGAEMKDNVCPACGYHEPEKPSPTGSDPVAPQAAAVSQGIPAVNDKKSVGLNILSFFIPLVGLILYFVQKDEKPIQAKSAGKSALGGFITGFVLTVILTVLLVALGMYGFSVLQEKAAGSDETPYITAQDGGDNAVHDGSFSNDAVLDWQSLTVVMDGVEVQFPCTYADFTRQTGYTLVDPTDLTEVLAVDDISPNMRACSAEGGEVYIRCYNNGSAEAAVAQCLVVGMTVDGWTSSTSVVLPQNVELRGEYQIEELTEKYGEPHSVYTGNTAYTFALWYADHTYRQCINIGSGDGKMITRIDFDIYPAE